MTRTVNLAGSEVARVGLGTNRLTRSAHNAEFIRAAAGAGIGLIDTAHTYTGGESETTIGDAFAEPGPRPLLATKGGFGGPGKGKPDVLRQQIETSLRRLGVDRIDLYYLHRIDPDTPLEDSLAAIKQFVDRGVIVNVGLSQVSIEEIERGRRVLPIAAVQNHYNLAERGYDDVVDYCTRQGIVFVPFFPLRAESAAAAKVAAERGLTAAQVALAWLLRRSPMMLPIPGTLQLEHVRQNVAAMDLELTDEEFEQIGAATDR